MSRLTQLQESAAAILAADSYFTPAAPAKPIDVLFERKGDIANKVRRALGKLGLSVVVVTPLAKIAEPMLGTIYLSVPLVVEVVENVTLNQGDNGTGKHALDVCEEIACLLHDRPHGVGDMNPRSARFQLTEMPITVVSMEPELVYHVNFTAPLTLSPRPPGGMPPVVVVPPPPPPTGGTGNATVPADAPIQPPQAWADASVSIFAQIADSSGHIDLSNRGITSVRAGPHQTGGFSDIISIVGGFAGAPNLNLSGNAITNVNAFLADLVTYVPEAEAVLDLSGGTNATPTGQGLVDLQTLRDAGWTVLTN